MFRSTFNAAFIKLRGITRVSIVFNICKKNVVILETEIIEIFKVVK